MLKRPPHEIFLSPGHEETSVSPRDVNSKTLVRATGTIFPALVLTQKTPGMLVNLPQ